MSINPAKANSGTTETFLTSLVTNAALLTFQVGVFMYLKTHLGRVYSPRTYLPPPDKRAPDLPKGIWRWIPAVLLTNPHEIIHANGLDAYMFLRFIRLMMIIFLVFTAITWPILLPINAAKIPGGDDSDGLDMLSWTHISNAAEDRYSAHIIIVWILTAFVVFMTRREMLHFVHMRHQFLISKSHAKLANARTVLITHLPDTLVTEHALRDWASFVPGGIEKTWIYRDTRELNDLFEEREKACKKLESATSSLLRDATKAWHARSKAHDKEVKHLQQVEKQERKTFTQMQKKGRVSSDIDPEMMIGGPAPAGVDEGPLVPPAQASWEFLEELVPMGKRPTVRPGKMGWAWIGKKEETYQWAKEEIRRLNEEIAEGRKHISNRKSLGTAFIECNLQLGAHVLAQCVSYHEPLVMANKWIEVSPKDVIWRNLDDSAIEVWTRRVSSWVLTVGLIILWAFPVAFVGSLSNVDDLCAQFEWLRWVCNAPKPAPGIIQGVLPPVFLALLMMILPILLRFLGWYENIPLKSLLSVSVYKRYYAFLVIHGFLIVTFSSAVSATIWSILQTPAKAVEDLAQKLPEASIFFLTYMVTQGLAGAASALIQLGALILHFIQKWFLGRTPRQAYKSTFQMPAADFGVILPRMSLLATIGFAYSVISPVINGLAVLSFFLFFLAWKFLFAYVFDQPDEMETGGLYFPLAINNLYVGLYIEQICLIALFALKIPGAGNPAIFIAEAVIMCLLLVLTFTAQMFIKNTFETVMEFLPMSLATQKMNERYRKHSLKPEPKPVEGASGVTAVVGKVEEELVDLFNRDRLQQTLRHRLRLRPEKNADGQHAKREEKRKKQEEKQAEIADKMEAAEDQAKAQEAHDHPTAFAQGGDVPPPAAAGVLTAPPMPLAEPSTPSTAASPPANHSGTIPLLPPPDAATGRRSSESTASSKRPHSPPHGLEIAPAAAALRNSEEEDADEEFEEHAFDHPSTYADQAWIWLPADPLGFSVLIAEDLRAAGVDASDLGATMDKHGTVEVSRNPPDEEWAGGHDR